MKFFIVLPLILLSYGGFAQVKSSSDSTKTVCPVCKSDKNSVDIVYGKPGQAAIKRAEKGQIRLGGCMVSEDSPRHYCKKDKTHY